MKRICCWVNYKLNYHLEPDSHIRNKIKVELDLRNYLLKRIRTYVDTSDLAAEKDFIALKTEVNKLDINKLVNIPTSWNNLKTKTWFRCWQIKNCSWELKKS